MIRVKFSRSLTRKMKLLLLFRLTKKFSSNETLIMNMLLYHNYSLNEKIKGQRNNI